MVFYFLDHRVMNNENKTLHLGSEEQFGELIKTGISLVDFYADWCGPCKMLAPIMEELAHDYGSKLQVIKVNVDDFGSLAAEYSVSSIPTVVIFKDGKKM